MSTCRWASYIGEPALCKIDEELVALPETEQVLRGQELMQMLAMEVAPVREEISSAPLAGEAKFDSGKAADFDWNVIVKKGFIEVVIPAENLRKRSMSDSALPRFKSPETQWKSLDKVDETSDASTNVSAEALDHFDASFGSPNRGDVSGSSDDGEAEAEVFAQPMVPYQYIQSPWWSPMGYDTSSISLPCTGYEQVSMDSLRLAQASSKSKWVMLCLRQPSCLRDGQIKALGLWIAPLLTTMQLAKNGEQR